MTNSNTLSWQKHSTKYEQKGTSSTDKDYLWKSRANIILNSKRLHALPLIWERHKCLLSPLLFNAVLKVLPTGITQEKKNEKHPGGKEKCKTISIPWWHDLVHIQRLLSNYGVRRLNESYTWALEVFRIAPKLIMNRENEPRVKIFVSKG